MTGDLGTPPPPDPPRVAAVPTAPTISWSPDFARVVTYNVTPLPAGERALLDWYRLPWWKRLTTRKPGP